MLFSEMTLTNLDLPDKINATGKELVEKGLPINIINQPYAVVITYKKTVI